MSNAKQMIHNQIHNKAVELLTDAVYSVQDDLLKHFEIYTYVEPNEIETDFDTLADAVTDSIIEIILGGCE